MLTGFVVYHSHDASHDNFRAPVGYYHFGTCLRSMILGFEPESAPLRFAGYQRYQGREAYGLMLEIICGLHSPMFGETEVLGQFREFARGNSHRFVGPINEVVGSLITDAKRIRKEFLQNIGSHSYGSLLRRKLPTTDLSVHFIGAGQLVEEILPWLKKQPYRVELFTRNIDKHAHLGEKYPELQLHSLQHFTNEKAQVVVIAAPIAGAELQNWLEHKGATYVFDLRGTSQQDPLDAPEYFPLHELFADIETNQKKVLEIKQQALSKVSYLAEEKYLQEKPRPFGWDDLWAM